MRHNKRIAFLPRWAFDDMAQLCVSLTLRMLGLSCVLRESLFCFLV